ncbi:unnamed protein product [Danaus chrysippus]|uniref:(African queen) hypothetical protein n=1 Tax=Danaus chrysippus TaxID=151541 RepID=A0A8J2R8P2_9NEOP|nr:unnamed protein product [Danaus chrysippus]
MLNRRRHRRRAGAARPGECDVQEEEGSRDKARARKRDHGIKRARKRDHEIKRAKKRDHAFDRQRSHINVECLWFYRFILFPSNIVTIKQH